MKRTLGPLSCLFFAASLFVGVVPDVASAQDAARPAKTARGRRTPPKVKKKKVRKAGRGSASETEGTAIAADDTANKATPPSTSDKHGKTKGRAETHAAEVTAKGSSGSTAAVAAAQQSAAGVNAQIVKEGDTSVKVMEFSGLGIEGRLKSPQLVYFTQRVRAEFERPQLPHRSFMPELNDSSRREPVR